MVVLRLRSAMAEATRFRQFSQIVTTSTAKRQTRSTGNITTILTPRGRDSDIANIKGSNPFQVQAMWEMCDGEDVI